MHFLLPVPYYDLYRYEGFGYRAAAQQQQQLGVVIADENNKKEEGGIQTATYLFRVKYTTTQRPSCG